MGVSGAAAGPSDSSDATTRGRGRFARDGAHRSQRGRGEDRVGNHCDVGRAGRRVESSPEAAAAVVSSLLGYTLRSSGRDTDLGLEKHGRL